MHENSQSIRSYEVGKLSNDGLIVRLRESVKQEKAMTLTVLRLLKEVEIRKIFLRMGYSSMYKFCLKELKYSESETQCRLQAMRLMKALPQIESRIQAGEISLTNAANIQTQFQREDFRRKEKNLEKISSDDRLEVVKATLNSSTRDCQKILASVFPEIQSEPFESQKILKNEKTLIQFSASPELIAKLERLLMLLSHKNYQNKYETLFESLAEISLNKLDPERIETRVRMKKEKAEKNEKISNAPLPFAPEVTSPSGQKVTARPSIPASLRRQIFVRDQFRCQYRDPQTGNKCTASHALEIDHIHPVSLGGGNGLQNLRLLCDQHNRWRSRGE